MSRNIRRLAPRSRGQNDRLIDRLLDTFGKGMITDKFRVPDGGTGELFNARDFNNELRGRQGSFLHTAADWALQLPFSGTLEEALSAGGVLEDAQVDDIIQTYSWKDFSGNELYAAKQASISYQTPIVSAYDLFKITGVGSEAAVEFLGNLAVPYKDYNYPRIGMSMTAYKEGNRIKSVSTEPFVQEMIGTYWNWGYDGTSGISEEFNGLRELIVGFDGGDLITQNSGDIPVHYYNFIQGPIYSSYYYQKLEIGIIQAEDRLYHSNIPFDGWREIPGIFNTELIGGDTIREFRPLEAEGVMSEARDSLLLSNNNGHFIIKFNAPSGLYYYKINDTNQDSAPVNGAVKIWGFKESVISDADDSFKYEIVGFPGYNDGSDITYTDKNGDQQTVPSSRAGMKVYFDGRIL